MDNHNQSITQLPLVTMQQGKAITTSRKVAEVFNKSHFHVQRDIKTLQIPTEIHQSNFGLIFYEDKYGRKQPEYTLTKDGMVLLVMGYNTDRAMAFKIQYINAFNAMQQQLEQQAKQQLSEAKAKQEQIRASSMKVSKNATKLVELAKDLDKSIKVLTDNCNKMENWQYATFILNPDEVNNLEEFRKSRKSFQKTDTQAIALPNKLNTTKINPKVAKQLIRERVEFYAMSTGKAIGSVYKKLYKGLLFTYNIDIYAYEPDNEESYLNVCMREGFLEQLLNVSEVMFDIYD